MKQKMLGSIALAGVLSLSVAGTALASDYHSPFTDLSPNSWCYGYVTSMVGHNFLSGYPDNTFRQDALITRAETATALSKLGLPAIIVSKKFYDVQSLTWYHDAIQKAYTSGVMLATNHDTTSDYYAPNDYLTRADAAIIASRLYGLHNTSVSLRQFTDSDEIPYGSEIHFKNLINAGIMSGYPDRTLRPNQPITRAEFSRIFNFICSMTSYDMQNNIRDSLEEENILNNDNDLSEVSLKLEVADKLTYGEESSARVKVKTENVPNGTVIPLSISGNGSNITIPSQITIYNDTASFFIYSSRLTAIKTYTLTATYEGMDFSTNVYLKKKDTQSNDVYIDKITVDGTLLYGKKDSVEIVVETEDIPKGEYVEGYITGPGLSLEDDEVKVKNNKAVFTVNSKSSTPTGIYTFKASYEGHYRTAKVVVAETKTDDPYIVKAEVSRNLKEGKNDRINITVYTNELPNGQYMTAALSGKNVYPASVGLSVTDQVLVYDNKAEFTIYSSSYTPKGTYYITFDYNGFSHRVKFYVSDSDSDTDSDNDENGYIKSITVDGYLREGRKDYVDVTVKTSGILDGTILYPEAEDDLKVPASCVVYNNKAEFYVHNPNSVEAGRYEISIRYNGETYTATVRVR